MSRVSEQSARKSRWPAIQIAADARGSAMLASNPRRALAIPASIGKNVDVRSDQQRHWLIRAICSIALFKLIIFPFLIF
jgi:hypothetical protein